MGYIDMHCDTLMLGFFRQAEDIYEIQDTHINVKRLLEAKADAQFFAAFFPKPGEDGMTHFGKMPPDLEYFAALRKLLFDTIEKHPDEIAFAGNWADLQANRQAGKVSAFLTIEDGRAVNGSFEQLQKFYEQGVRLITLTWNFENCFGAPNSTNPAVMQKGLTEFGKEAIEVFNEKGILIDVSHLSDGGFWDVARITRKPFVASHSNARSLSPHPRNLTDEMIRALAEKGGVAGLNLNGPFLQEDISSHTSTVERMAAHVEYMYQVGGEDIIAIGTDFDGIGGELEIQHPEQLEQLFAALQKKGFSERLLEKFRRENVERVIRETL
ncbi:MAG: membrane dipeptidase [Lachnospiraceae bacterium]|nr:membrane dipeptidase [Lachnospiraceae bacterium]